MLIFSKASEICIVHSLFWPISEARAIGGVAKLFVAWAGDCRAVVLRGRLGALEEVGPWSEHVRKYFWGQDTKKAKTKKTRETDWG